MVEPLQAGTVIGDYELVRSIGRGGMAEVWVARRRSDRRASKYVAIKVIADQYVGDPRYQRMFGSEADLAALLNHTNIVQVFDEGEDHGRSFLVMEWVDGVNLLKVAAALTFVDDEQWRYKVISYIVGQLLYALNYAHSITLHDGNPLGIVHRDVSPQNVLISTQGEVKLTDFGVAHYVLEESSGIHVKGKVRYMSPEQISGKGRDPRLDLYAVGAILHELLDGRRFRHHIEDQREMYLEALGGKIPAMSRPIPPELDALRRALLEPELDRRVPNADAALEMLSRFPGHGDARRELTELCSSVTGVMKPRVGPQGAPPASGSSPGQAASGIPGLTPSSGPAVGANGPTGSGSAAAASPSGPAAQGMSPSSGPAAQGMSPASGPAHAGAVPPSGPAASAGVPSNPVPSARLLSPRQAVPAGVPQQRSQPISTVPMPGAQGSDAMATGSRRRPGDSGANVHPADASATWTPSLQREPALPAPQTDPTELVEPVAAPRPLRASPSAPIVELSDSALPETRLSRRPVAAPVPRKSGQALQWTLFGMAIVVLIAAGAGTWWYLFGRTDAPETSAAVAQAPATDDGDKKAPAAAAAPAPAEVEPPPFDEPAEQPAQPGNDAAQPTADAAEPPPSDAAEADPPPADPATDEAPPPAGETAPSAEEPKPEEPKPTTRRRPRSALSIAASKDMGTVNVRIKSKDGSVRKSYEFSALKPVGRLPTGRYTVSWRRAGTSAWSNGSFVLKAKCDLRLVIKPTGMKPTYLGTCG
ncbi:MAG: protein kinase [Myxococcota bacterium]